MKLHQKLAAAGTTVAAALCLGTGSAQAQDEGPPSPLKTPSVTLVCFPAGQTGQGNTFTGTQNISCGQSPSQGTTTPTAPPARNGGLSRYEIAASGSGVMAPGEVTTVYAECPAGKVAVGGGFYAQPNIQTLGSYPVQVNTIWAATGQNNSNTQGTITAYAVCADAATA